MQMSTSKSKMRKASKSIQTDPERCSDSLQEMYYGECSHRPDMQGILISGKRGKLLSVLYTAGGAGPHPTVLLLHGIPGCEQNLDLAHALRRAGFHVMTFHYSGSWGSDGNYALRHNLEDTETVLDYVLSDSQHCIDKEHIFAVGHSMGGFVCGHLTARRPEVKAGVLLMPCDIGRLPMIDREDAHSGQIIREVLEDAAQWLSGTSGVELVREVMANSQNFSLENLAEVLAQKPLLCIAGALDSYTPQELHCVPLANAVRAAGGTMFRLESYPTDHFFSDFRLSVADTVIEYLQSQLL